MRLRTVAVLMLVAAALLHFGVSEALRARALDAAGQLGRLQDAHRKAEVQAQAERRREARRARAAAILARFPAPTADPLASLRAVALAALEDRGLTDVQLKVSPGIRGSAASLHLRAQGPFDEVLRLTEALSGSGLTLDRVGLRRTTSGVSLDLDAARTEALP